MITNVNVGRLDNFS